MTREDPSSVRIDKWLWAVRLYKTRSLAAEACKAGKVKFNGEAVKAAREVKTGDIYTLSLGPLVRTVKVTALLHNRVAGKLVENYLEDLTPADVYEQQKMMREMRQGIRPRGFGRPTKKERRDMEDFGAF